MCFVPPSYPDQKNILRCVTSVFIFLAHLSSFSHFFSTTGLRSLLQILTHHRNIFPSFQPPLWGPYWPQHKLSCMAKLWSRHKGEVSSSEERTAQPWGCEYRVCFFACLGYYDVLHEITVQEQPANHWLQCSCQQEKACFAVSHSFKRQGDGAGEGRTYACISISSGNLSSVFGWKLNGCKLLLTDSNLLQLLL